MLPTFPDLHAPLQDAFSRALGSLRLSVTDRCNLRCQYCMPEEEYVWLERAEILRFEEIAVLAGVFAGLGVDRFRLTGGEPLLRRDLDRLVRLLSDLKRRSNPSEGGGGGARPGAIHDLALTTNGVLLASQAKALRAAGLDRVTVSLDTLRPDRFRQHTRQDTHRKVLEGITAARDAGFPDLKINSVVIRGFNDDELADLIAYGREAGAEMRFIEYMDVGGATRWSMDQVLPRAAMLERLKSSFGPIEHLRASDAQRASAPAERFRLPDGTVFGIISSTTQPFCGACDRARLTPDGVLLLCLYARRGVDLKAPLRAGAARSELEGLIARAWQGRTDRGAEERRAFGSREALFRVEDLRRDPHLEMHTRGG